MMADQNPDSHYQNRDVLKPYVNGKDITTRMSNTWIVDFSHTTSLEVASKYVLPMQHVITHVKLFRDAHQTEKLRRNWWLFEAPRPAMLKALQPLTRYIATPTVAKHRLFVWLPKEILPDHQLIVFARDDDYFFGVLHSRLHEVWSLRMGTWLGKGNDPRYTPTTTFETFPFPWSPGQEPIHPLTPDPSPHRGEGNDLEKYHAIAAAAKQLHEERDAWLNPPEVSGKALRDRTLTNLYNALMVFRGKETIRVTTAAGDFAPRLDELHRRLDEAVCAAYGWDAAILQDEEAMLRELLALNLARAAGS
jgi:hypothetical protein